MFLLLLLLLGVVTLCYFICTSTKNFFKNKGVVTAPFVPVFGDCLNLIRGKEHFADMLQRVYNLKEAENLRYVGSFQFTKPVLLLKAPNLIKQMCVKDFDCFLNHRSFLPENDDDIMTKNLFMMKGQKWKNMRSTLSPSFTSSKMKAMFVLICRNAEAFVQHFLKKSDDIIETEFKLSFTKYTNDVIANVAFGVQVDSLEEPHNDFYLMGKDASNFGSTSKKLKMFLFQLFPHLATFLGIRIITRDVTNFFYELIEDAIKLRETQNIIRPDMLGFMINAKNDKLSNFDIVAQAFAFFLAGFESVASTMCFAAYELAVNPEIQQKLIDEIDQSSPFYDTIMNLTYLDMVISETLRKWPVAIATDRVVTKPYTIKPELVNEQALHLNVDDVVCIPIYALHHDPKFYPKPEKFDPERFSPHHRETINPYTYIPFGVGPRNCLGSRLALLEIKCVFFYLLKHFNIVPVAQTSIPLKLDRANLNLGSADGFVLGLKRR